jgi:very-short-patch-repair endonuclease
VPPPTEAERKLWWHLRHRIPTLGTHFRRQVRIGPYIADFACYATRTVIEVDGGHHGGSTVDEARTKVLAANGYRVLRYWNNDVLTNIDGVLEDILSAITTTPPPPHKGEGSTPSARQRHTHRERIRASQSMAAVTTRGDPTTQRRVIELL